MRKKVVNILALGALLSVLVSDMSSDVSKKSNEINKVRLDIDAAKQTMQRLSLEKNKLQAQLADIETRYGQSAAQLKELSHQISDKQRNLQRITHESSQQHDTFDVQRRELMGQVKSAYALGQREQLKLVLNQQEPALSSRVMVYYRYFNQARLAKIAETQATMRQIVQLQEEQTTQQTLLSETEKLQQTQQTLFFSIKKDRDDLLAQLNHEVFSHEQQLTRLSESETKLKNLIASLQSQEEALVVDTSTQKSPEIANNNKNIVNELPFNAVFSQFSGDFTKLKGKLPWPVRGKLAQTFGSKRAEGTWDGIIIDANEGAEIHAVSGGKVAFADWLRGYGLLIIIDHGNEYMSLYAFNQSLYKKKGESVNAGEVIASVGQSGGRSQTGLYFGIRKKGTPIDPLEWCRN